MKRTFIAYIVITLGIFSCKKEKDKEPELSLPTVSTANITNITLNSATGGGEVTSDGNANIGDKGIIWSTSPNVSASNGTSITSGGDKGAFVSSITNLASGTTYYVKAYAKNHVGTAFGNEVSFKTLSPGLPVVTTDAATYVTATSAISGGNISSDGGVPVTVRGICWGTSPAPTTAGSITSEGSGTGAFVSFLTGLTSKTKYYTRAYATNMAGTSYGAEMSFTTE